MTYQKHKCLNVPKIIKYNKTKTMTTVCVGKCNVSDFYGEDKIGILYISFNKIRELYNPYDWYCIS